MHPTSRCPGASPVAGRTALRCLQRERYWTWCLCNKWIFKKSKPVNLCFSLLMLALVLSVCVCVWWVERLCQCLEAAKQLLKILLVKSAANRNHFQFHSLTLKRCSWNIYIFLNRLLVRSQNAAGSCCAPIWSTGERKPRTWMVIHISLHIEKLYCRIFFSIKYIQMELFD